MNALRSLGLSTFVSWTHARTGDGTRIVQRRSRTFVPLLFLLANFAIGSARASADMITFTAADALGHDLFGKWLQDEKDKGQFFLFHFGNVTSDNTNFLVGRMFTSPNNFWEVVFGKVEEDTIAPLPDVDLPSVQITGTFKHVTKADPDDTRDFGDPFAFNLIVSTARLSDEVSGATDHPAAGGLDVHKDFHSARLFALVADQQSEQFLSYGFSVGATHPVQGLIPHPSGGLLVPEPSSLTLLGMGAISLIGYGWRRKRKQAA